MVDGWFCTSHPTIGDLVRAKEVPDLLRVDGADERMWSAFVDHFEARHGLLPLAVNEARVISRVEDGEVVIGTDRRCRVEVDAVKILMAEWAVFRNEWGL